VKEGTPGKDEAQRGSGHKEEVLAERRATAKAKKSRGQYRSERTREKNKTESDLEKNDWKVTRAFTCDDSEK
jgi:hypothetical protein